MESKVRRPMTIGWPIVVRLKNAKSSGRCHGIALPDPMTPLRPTATSSETRVIPRSAP